MKSRIDTIITILLLLIFCLAPAAYCSDADAVNAADEAQASELAEEIAPALVIGTDTYIGTSNLADRHRFSDGMWAGSGTFFPSKSYLQWRGAKGDAVMVSVGTGDLYEANDSTLDQPVEAYWEKPLGSLTLTAGKFYVPYAQQEWLYDAKPGIMTAWGGDRFSFTTSFNYSSELERTHLYVRSAYKMAENAELGLSFGIGEGFCANSIHNRGIALDTTINYAGFRLYGEYTRMGAKDPGNLFSYISGKLYYDKLGRLSPFIASYYWKDHGDSFGNFKSTLVGIDYQITSYLAIQGATSTTSDRGISWLQFHWTWETSFKHF